MLVGVTEYGFGVPQPPPGYVPASPPPSTTHAAPLRALPALQAPVWGQQPGESSDAFRAFLAGLQGGAAAFDSQGKGGGWALAARSTGLPDHWLRATSENWAWPTRAREYWAHVRKLAYDAAQPLRDQLAAMHAQRARTHQLALDLEELELRKLLHQADGTQGEGAVALPASLDVRSLARLRQVNASVSEQLRREASGIAPEASVDDGGGIAWDKLSDVEAEAYRELRNKAGL
jgi:hypothetical protein